MNVPDQELVRALESRDGPLGSRWRPHRTDVSAPCPYEELYPNGECPWCGAEARRVAVSSPESKGGPAA